MVLKHKGPYVLVVCRLLRGFPAGGLLLRDGLIGGRPLRLDLTRGRGEGVAPGGHPLLHTLSRQLLVGGQGCRVCHIRRRRGLLSGRRPHRCLDAVLQVLPDRGPARLHPYIAEEFDRRKLDENSTQKTYLIPASKGRPWS